MRDAGMLILPSDGTGWGAVVNEALLAGTPALTSDACGASSLLAQQKDLSVFRRGSAEDLANSMAAHQPMELSRRATLADWARRAMAPSALVEYLLYTLSNPFATAIPVPWKSLPLHSE